MGYLSTLVSSSDNYFGAYYFVQVAPRTRAKRKSKHENTGGKPITESPVFHKIKELPVTNPKNKSIPQSCSNFPSFQIAQCCLIQLKYWNPLQMGRAQTCLAFHLYHPDHPYQPFTSLLANLISSHLLSVPAVDPQP